MITPLTFVPETIIAGTSVKFQIAWNEFSPLESYTTSFEAAGTAGSIVASGVGNPDNSYLFSITPTQTNLAAGILQYNIFARLNTDVFLIQHGQVNIVAQPSAGTDARSDARIARDTIKAEIKARATGDVQSYSIAGRSLTHITMTELLMMLGVYEAEVRAEDAANRVAAGMDSGNTIRVRFTGR